MLSRDILQPIRKKQGHVDFSLGGSKFGSLTSFTYSDFDDLLQGSKRRDEYPDFGKRPFYQERINGEDVMMPNEDENLQVASGYTQYDFLQKFTYQQNEHVNHQRQPTILYFNRCTSL